MTREEAIKHGCEQLEVFGGEHREFIEMAIKSLKQESSEDCVSRQMVTDAVEKTIAKYIPTFIGKYEKIPLELAIAIRDVPPASPTCKEWIPVSERLPKKGGWYICTCYNGAIKTVTFFKWQTRLKQWEKTGTRAYWKIIAWQPLPEPYAGGEEV